ncbi:MAG: S41 family peptidase [Acidobacteria bacterium]|nr:S41 family peptidase [Acidobacteriota bacterium]
MRKNFYLVTLLFLLVASLAGGFLGEIANADDKQVSTKESLYRNYAEILAILEQNAARKPETSELIYSSIRLMLQKLDPHSAFFSPKEYKQMEEDNSGYYFGLGIRIRPLTRGSGRIIIVEPPDPGTPAAKVDLQAGDVIFKVNGESIDDWEVDDVIDNLKGPKGTRVHITVLRPGKDEPLELDVIRDEIPKWTINYAYRIRPNIGYVKIEHFSETTHDELMKSLEKLNVDSLEGLVIDLRDNPGGYLTQSIKISQEFLPKGAPIVSTMGRDGEDEQKYNARQRGDLKVPLVILINNNSASASEIVAGAVQDNDRGIIVGERSFGKGLVQSVYRLADGSGLALTTGKYYAPSGRCLQRPYSGSIYDYYNARRRKNVDFSDVDVRYTLSQRKVYGGGGIQPDIVQLARKLNRFEMVMYSKDVFFKFATQAMQGKVESLPKERLKNTEAMRHFQVTEEVIKDFKGFLSEIKVSYTDTDFNHNLDMIQRGIKSELYTRVFGVLAGFKIRAEGDEQIHKALEVIPQARAMLLKTKEILATIEKDKWNANL